MTELRDGQKDMAATGAGNGSRRRLRGITGRIIKALGLFGSVEVIRMACSVVRIKLMALWGGVAGVGLIGLYSVALDMLTQLANAGLRTSAVKEISSAHGAEETSRRVWLVRRLAVRIALAVSLLTVIASPLLSWITFGNISHSMGFAMLGAGVFMMAMVYIESAVMQGRGLLGNIARATLYSAPVALVLSAVMIYYWRSESAIPVLLTYCAVTFAAYYLLRARVPEPESFPGPRPLSLMRDGRPIVLLGLAVMLTGVSSWLASYIVMSYVNHRGGLVGMGYYQTGFTVAIHYVGMVFTALGVEYFPRLSAAASGGMKRLRLMMNHQIRVVIWIVTPLALIMTVLAPWVVDILYSKDFSASVPLIRLAMPGLVLRAVSFCMGYVILSRGDGRLFMVTELMSCLLCVALNITGYAVWGLAGVGVSFCLWYLLYTVILTVALWLRYGIVPDRITALTAVVLTAVTAVVVAVSV